jgi:superfamily II DNA or RNA helicase
MASRRGSKSGNGSVSVGSRIPAVKSGNGPKRSKSAAPAVAKKTPRTHRPADMSLEDWQIALRREFAVEQEFGIENVGGEPVFSEYIVTNPKTKGRYRVAIRGERPGANFCSCPDFSVNTLGTCKHIEYTLAKLRRRRAARAALARGFQPPYSEVYLRYGLKREVIFGPGTACPPAFRDLASRYFDRDGVLKPEGYGQFETFLKQAGQDGHEVRCYDDALGFVAHVRDDARRRERVDEAFRHGSDSAAFKGLLKTALYPYQRLGALFAARAGRCLVADDMGLGKTIQAIAAAEILARVAGIERVLVITPTSLKHQWKDEIARFTDRPAQVIEGLIAARAAHYASESFYKITNYDVIHRDVEPIRKWAPDLIILDEAQRIKNWKTRAARTVKQLPSEHALVLTGTPLENRLEELHSIVEFVDRFRLGPAFRFLAEHQHTDEGGRVIGYKNLSRIATTLAPILVRRTKQEVLPELPERLDKNFFVEMTAQQRDHHEENYQTVVRIVAKWRRQRFLSDSDQQRLMIALQNMRMACNSTYLLDHSTDYGVKADELLTLLEEILEDPEAKVVVFSQWVRTHELIVRRVEPRQWDYVLFHGGVPGPRRKDLIRRFKSEPSCRLFLSTDAGGVGLNLQNASVVINMDQPWNPAVLEQRIGRVHRLGQHRAVRVVNFVAQGTIEHGMLELLAFKKSLFAGVLDSGADEVFLGGTRLKRFMESVENVTGAIPAAMPVQAEPATAVEKLAGETETEAEAETFAAMVAEADEKAESEAAAEVAAVAGAAGVARRQQAWTDVLSAGLTFLEKLGQAFRPPQEQSGAAPLASVVSSFVARDKETGEPYLRLPMPQPETLAKITDLLQSLARGE